MWSVPRDGVRRTMPGILPSYGAWLVSFSWAAAFVALAVLARAAFEFLTPGLPPYPTFFVAVLFATLLHGAAAGLFAMVLGAIGGAWFLANPPLTSTYLAAVSALYVGTSLLVVWGVVHFKRLAESSRIEQQRRDRHEQLIVNQNEILARIAAGAPLSEVFDKLIRTIEELSDHAMLGSILLFDRAPVKNRIFPAPGRCRRAVAGKQG